MNPKYINAGCNQTILKPAYSSADKKYKISANELNGKIKAIKTINFQYITLNLCSIIF